MLNWDGAGGGRGRSRGWLLGLRDDELLSRRE